MDTTGAPVRDARVILAYATDSVTTVSDSLGRFDLRIAFVRGDAAGSLYACKQGFYPASLAYWAGPGVHNDLPLVLRVDTTPGRPPCR